MARIAPKEVVAGRYELSKELGRGGFASVFSAVDLRTGDTVALKFLAKLEDQTRFAIEARALQKLDHPNCLRVLDQGEADGNLFIVSEFLDGPTLHEWLHEPRTFDDRFKVARELAQALEHAHSNGVLHHDFKPANILLTWDDHGWSAHVVDFGLSKLVGVYQPDVTATGEVIGTPGFMSPEQLRGLRNVGPKSDMYCLGLVLYEMFEGTPPFHGPNALTVCMQHLKDDPPPMRSVDPGLSSLIMRLLSKSPRVRPSARGTVRQLDRLFGPPDTLPWRRVGARTHGLVRVVVVLVILAALAGFVRWWMTPSPPPPPQVRPRVVVHQPQVVEQPEDSDLGSIADASDEARATPGCGKPLDPGRQFLSTLDGLERRQIEGAVPQGYDPRHPHPLVIALHEGNQTPGAFLDEIDVVRLADELGAVVVAPNGKVIMQSTWGVEPVPTIRAAQALAEETACVDPNRVVLLGHGVGSRAGLAATCESAYHALIITSLQLDRAEPPPCVASPPTPTLYLFTLPYELPAGCGLGDNRISISESVSIWRERQNCRDRSTNRDLDHGTCRDWACDVELTTCEVAGGAHWRPGHTHRCDGPASPFDFHAEIARFLRDDREVQ